MRCCQAGWLAGRRPGVCWVGGGGGAGWVGGRSWGRPSRGRASAADRREKTGCRPAQPPRLPLALGRARQARGGGGMKWQGKVLRKSSAPTLAAGRAPGRRAARAAGARGGRAVGATPACPPLDVVQLVHLALQLVAHRLRRVNGQRRSQARLSEPPAACSTQSLGVARAACPTPCALMRC